MSPAASAVRVTALSEWPDMPGLGLVVQATPAGYSRAAIIGAVRRSGLGWTAGVRTGIIRHRVIWSVHPTAATAVAAIMNSRVGQRLGVRADSTVTWSDAAGRAARDAWGAGVTTP